MEGMNATDKKGKSAKKSERETGERRISGCFHYHSAIELNVTRLPETKINNRQ